VLRIRDVYLGSDFFPSQIPDPTFFHPQSRIRIFPIPDPRSRGKKGIGSRIRIPGPDPDFFPIPDPRSRGKKGIGSRIRIRYTAYKGTVYVQASSWIHKQSMSFLKTEKKDVRKSEKKKYEKFIFDWYGKAGIRIRPTLKTIIIRKNSGRYISTRCQPGVVAW
jgi:hypothetical protein